MTLGRSSDNDIVVQDAGISRQHCRFSVRGGQVLLIDLESTNGTQVNGQKVTETSLRDGDSVVLGSGVEFRYLVLTAEEREIEKNLLESASKDSLTGVYHRQAWLERAASLFRRFQRKGRAVSLALCEIDQYLHTSHEVGQTAADSLLLELCRKTRALGREALVGRPENGRIGLVLPGFPLARALQRMQKLAQDVARHPIEVRPEQLIPATLSIGVVSSLHFMEMEAFLSEARNALEKSLRDGGNRVCGHQLEPVSGHCEVTSTSWLVLKQKRETIRTRHRRPIMVTSEKGDCEGELLDVGRGGMRIRLSLPLGPGWPVEVSPHETPDLRVNMVVKWQRGEQCGLRFVDSSIESSWIGEMLSQFGHSSQMFVDRRGQARVAWRRRLKFTTDKLAYQGETTSLSYGGLCIVSPMPPPLRADGQVQVEGFKAQARVVWVKNQHFGLRFAPLTSGQEKHLLELMKLAQKELAGL